MYLVSSSWKLSALLFPKGLHTLVENQYIPPWRDKSHGMQFEHRKNIMIKSRDYKNQIIMIGNRIIYMINAMFHKFEDCTIFRQIEMSKLKTKLSVKYVWHFCCKEGCFGRCMIWLLWIITDPTKPLAFRKLLLHMLVHKLAYWKDKNIVKIKR